MERLVIIGANDFQNQLIMKAKDMGYETHVFAWRDGSVGEQTADYFYPISIVEKEKILEECRRIKPRGIVSIASDLAVITINYVAEKLNLTCNGISTSKYTTNKFEMRLRLTASDLPVPNFYITNHAEVRENVLNFPLIVKPTDRSGSRGIMKVYNEKELAEAINYASSFSFERRAIVEEFLEGDEYSCECISFQGNHKMLAITKKYTTGAPHFIEKGHLEPAPLSSLMYKKIEALVKKALTSLSIMNGASHTEIKIDKDDIHLIEIGARMGGDCIGSDLVFLSTGYDYLKMVIQVACGEKPYISEYKAVQKAGIKFLFNKCDIQKMESVKEKYPNAIVRINIERKDQKEVTDSSMRLGYFIFVGYSSDDILQEFEHE